MNQQPHQARPQTKNNPRPNPYPRTNQSRSNPNRPPSPSPNRAATSTRPASSRQQSGAAARTQRPHYPTHLQTNPSAAPTARRRLAATQTRPPRRKIPEALPTKPYKESALEKIKNTVFPRRAVIREIVREPTAGGIVFRMNPAGNDIEILLIQDSKERWTIPKGHIEPGETAKQTAIREIGEEAGLFHIQALTWLGKIHFKYRRLDQLVLMTTQVYLVHALDKTETPTKEKWMKGIKWFSFSDALDAIEYDDIEKLMLIAKKKIRAGEL